MAQVDDEMPLIDFSDDPTTSSSSRSATRVDLSDITPGQSDSDGSASTDGEDAAAYLEPSTEDLKQEAQMEAFFGYVTKERERDVAESAAEMTAPKHDDFKPEQQLLIDKAREYQQELFERAKEENVIAVLDTGSGKTLIACLLIRHTLEQEQLRRAAGGSPKVVFFLANSVHLVKQQGKVLGNNLLDAPRILSGKNDLGRRDVWEDIREHNAVVVCPPAILDTCLAHAYLKMSDISLLVFDEAHHAKKDHPYSRLIRSYYLKCPVSQRPKIFGMTASPVDAKRSIEKATQDLEEVLHAKVVTTDDLSILSFAPKPTDEKWIYSRLRLTFQTDLCYEIWRLANFSADFKRFFDFAKLATSELGPWCADRVWKYATGQTTSSIQRRYEQSQAYQDLSTVGERLEKLQALDDAVNLIDSRLVEVPGLVPTYLSSKVVLLYERLSAIYDKNPKTRAIVFVSERLKALLLRDVFEALPIANLRVGVLLGIAAGNNEGTSVKDQEQILEHFRAGLINLVFATSVADEGLDIPQCNLCVRFDLCTTTIQYMQSRGRARMHGSIFAHMVEDNNFDHHQGLEFQMEEEQYLKKWCAALPADRKLGKGTSLDKLLARDTSIRAFETSSGAVCDASNCLLILSRFAASLAHLGATDKEIYEEEIDSDKNLFRYAVRLPKSENFEVRGCRGDWKPNKQLAKRSAAWSCCFLLRQKGELNENLDSIHQKFKPANANARLAVTAKQFSYDMQVKPSLWQTGLGCIPKTLYAAIIHFASRGLLKYNPRDIVLLTKEKLPQFPAFAAYLEHGVKVDIQIETLDRSFPVSNVQLDLLTSFTLNSVFADIFNKVYEHDAANMSYWLAPTTGQDLRNTIELDHLVDFKRLSACEQERVVWSSNMPHEFWTNKFLCDPLNGRFHYFTSAVVPGATIYDPVRADMPNISHKSRNNIIDFSDSHWTKSRKKKSVESQYDELQPVLEADLVGTRRNFLDPDTTIDLIPCRIAPQTLQVARIDGDVAASCLVWPAIIHRLESYLIALEAFEKLGLYEVSPELALEAFTKDAESEEEQETNPGGKLGMGKNYERLEFIGDSLLKMTTTMAVFIRTNYNEEGMHCRRMEILCNRRLYDVASGDLMLYKHARSQPFNRIAWYPENIKLISGRGAKNPPEVSKHVGFTQNLGMKTIADISEAIIGAAVLTSQQKFGNLDLGIQAITKLVQSEDHKIEKWADFAQTYTAPEWSLPKDDVLANELAEKIYTKTGYTFQHPRLGRSAFTHSSDMNSPVPDLQRLEFLGDAVFDWVCISWLFDRNPNKNPQWLTEHKMAMVSNKFLAALAVTLDFDKLIFTSTVQLLMDIETYATKVREARATLDCKPSFWTEIERPPKALADLVESYLGALLVDSNFDYSKIEAFFEKHVKPFFLNIEDYDSFANRHPTTFLFKKLGQEFKCRDYRILDSEPTEGKIEVEITAGVIVHNKVLATDKGSSAKYARVRACKKVVAAMDGMSREQFRRTYGCNCPLRED